jgi:hypothetical protein
MVLGVYKFRHGGGLFLLVERGLFPGLNVFEVAFYLSYHLAKEQHVLNVLVGNEKKEASMNSRSVLLLPVVCFSVVQAGVLAGETVSEIVRATATGTASEAVGTIPSRFRILSAGNRCRPPLLRRTTAASTCSRWGTWLPQSLKPSLKTAIRFRCLTPSMAREG